MKVMGAPFREGMDLSVALQIWVERWGELCFVGADVLDGPFRIPEKTLLGIRNLRGVEDVAPYVG
jgi:hypothetical protein